MKLPVFLATLVFWMAGCGSDGVIVFRTNLGVVDQNPDCAGAAGTFDLRDREGLVILVVVREDTRIFLSSGATGRCGDLRSGDVLRVRGEDDGGRILAETIEVR